MPSKSDDFILESTARVPAGATTLTDAKPRAHWLLSNGRGWRIALSQNNADSPPQILATPAVLFVGLYHGTLASVSRTDGRIISQAALPEGNAVFWSEAGGYVIAEGEMAVGVFRPTGEFLWQKAMADVIAYVEVVEDSLKITDAAGRVSRYDLESGKSIG